jgi:hypothetical protein
VNERVFKVLGGFFIIIVLMSLCSKRDRNPRASSRDQYNVNVQTMVSASDGLNLKAVGELLKKAETAEQFETLLNSSKEGVNNLDLNEDGKADYIKVSEFGDEKVKGFSLTTEPAAGEVQELATIEIEKVSDSDARMQVHGNEQMYGNNHYHHSSFGMMDMLILGYIFRPHTMFASPYGYGNYPGGYGRYNTRTNTAYQRNMNNATRGSSFQSSGTRAVNSNVTSPNAGKSAKSVKAPLKNPTTSQRQFQAQNPSKQTRSGGFGRSSSSSRSTSKSRSVRSSPSRRSGGSSRGGK